MKKYLPTSYAAASLELVSQGYTHDDVSRVLLAHLRKAKKLSLLPVIIQSIEEYEKAGKGEVIDVYTAHPLDEKQRKEIAKLCEHLYHTEVTVRSHEDSSLVGGITLKRGDEVTDFSVTTLVDNLHTHIKQ